MGSSLIYDAYIDINGAVSTNCVLSEGGFSISGWFQPSNIETVLSSEIDLFAIYENNNTIADNQIVSVKLENGIINLYKKTALQDDLGLNSNMVKTMVCRYNISDVDKPLGYTNINRGYVYFCITSDKYSTRIYYSKPNGELYSTYFWLGLQDIMDSSKEYMIRFGYDVKNSSGIVPYSFDDIMLYNNAFNFDKGLNNYLMQCTLLPGRSITIENSLNENFPYIVNSVIKETSCKETIIINEDYAFNYNNWYTATVMFNSDSYMKQPTHPLKYYVEVLPDDYMLYLDIKNTVSGGTFYNKYVPSTDWAYPYQYYSYVYPEYTGLKVSYDYYQDMDGYQGLIDVGKHMVNLVHPETQFDHQDLGYWIGYGGVSSSSSSGLDVNYIDADFDYLYYRRANTDYCYWKITGSFKQTRNEEVPTGFSVRFKNVYNGKYLKFKSGTFSSYFDFTENISEAAVFEIQSYGDNTGEYFIMYFNPKTQHYDTTGPSSNSAASSDYLAPQSKNKGRFSFVYVKKNLNRQSLYRIVDRTYKEYGYNRFLTTKEKDDYYLRLERFQNGRPYSEGGMNLGNKRARDLWIIEVDPEASIP